MIAIETKNLSKKYKNKYAVNKLNLKIKKGELFALLGVNGAGKTTIIKMLTCLSKPSEGEAFLNGKNIIKDILEIKNMINISPQETAIAPNLTVKENLEFIASIYEINNKEEKTNKLIELFDLEEIKNQKSNILSGGWKRRLSIAMALVNNPQILFLDEPTLGLDVLARRELWNIIKSLKKEVTIILTTHYMEEAEFLYDRIGILSKGCLLEVGTSEELIKKTKTKNFEDAFVKIATGGKE